MHKPHNLCYGPLQNLGHLASLGQYWTSVNDRYGFSLIYVKPQVIGLLSLEHLRKKKMKIVTCVVECVEKMHNELMLACSDMLNWALVSKGLWGK